MKVDPSPTSNSRGRVTQDPSRIQQLEEVSEKDVTGTVRIFDEGESPSIVCTLLGTKVI